MNSFSHTGNDTITCTHCITGETEDWLLDNDRLISISKSGKGSSPFFSGPGLVDLQVNGICGIDFNIPTVTAGDILNATQYLLTKGITTFFPTVITNSDEHIIAILRTVAAACKKDPLVAACIGGIHLEGPFLSPSPGAKGAHDKAFIRPPDWELFSSFQEAAEGNIKIITLAPEWEGAPEFIEKCTRSGVIVSIGHSLANTSQIKKAVKAGARMSTHLGNAIPLLLPRHPNIIWDQLAEDDLYTCIIADGIHIPDSFIKVVLKIKGDRTMIVSDATCFAGMEPGEYQTHIGNAVVLDSNKRISLKEEPGLLAGAAKSLLENIETLLEHELCSLGATWQMASSNVTAFLHAHGKSANDKDDKVIFTVEGSSVLVQKVIKNGKLVFSK